ncbi:MAG: PhnD/SsuA/transferrin family substrate-binding protein [Betaproteobacteria bacterium]|nr:PhnD/SsuA/transferrin family substrate-binding protein [Betaproteobacteria bacterium]MBP6645167.1 PhnD/SsuA/transferrin family substrate-binding protein [Burkholderiaceae bacterium]
MSLLLRFILVILVWWTLPYAYAEDVQTVRMGFYQGSLREMSRVDLREAFTLWTKELSVAFKLPMEVFFYEDIASMRLAFDRGEINSVSADAMTLARGFKVSELAEGYSVAVPHGWNMLLMAGRDSQVQTVNDLAGKRIAVLENDLTSTVYLETLCLRHYARECNKVFSEIQRLPSSNQTLMRVFFGKADLTLAYKYSYEVAREMNPQLETKMGRVVDELPLGGVYYAFFSVKVRPEHRQQALKAIPMMNTYPRGRQLLDLFKMDHLEVVHSQELKPFIQMDQTYRDLRAQITRKATTK